MDREIVLNEYFQLINHLNKANKLPDQKTSIHFEIRRELSFHVVHAISTDSQDEHHLGLASRDRKGPWERTGYSPFSNFEEYLAETLNIIEESRTYWPSVLAEAEIKVIIQLWNESLQNFLNSKTF